MYKIICTLILTLLSTTMAAQEKFLQTIDEIQGPSAQNFYEDIYDDFGNYSSIPVSIIKGKNPGPTFTIVSGVHGYEYPPIIAAQNLIQEIDPSKLSGQLIIIPMANPNAFYSRSPYVNPQDQLNLNRVFPGSKQGTITEKIANYLTEVIIAKSDVFVDVHGGDAGEDLLPFVCYYNNESRPKETAMIKKLAEASGFSYVVAYPYTLRDDQAAKYAFKQAVQDGKVALSIECGKLGNVQIEAVEEIKMGIYNMLAEIEMYPQKTKMKTDFITLNQQSYIRSNHRGVFFSDYNAGDQVKAGMIVGTIKDAFGNTIKEVVAPNSGLILYKIGTPPVNAWETIMCIGYNE
ncbi:MAG: M14 family metallopeptidase [Bacteroidota bacterium]